MLEPSDTSLASIFREHAGTEVSDVAALGAALRQMHVEGERAWPGLGLPLPDYVRHVAARAASAGGVPSPHAADLYLACACAAQLRGAVDAFDRAYLGQVEAILSRSRPSPALVDEVRQVVRDKLFVGGPRAAPRIAEYDGRGALATWVRVIARRAAIDLGRRARVRAEDGEHLLEDVAAPDVEHRHDKRRYRRAFNEAIEAAVRALDAGQREILRLHFVEGVTLDRLAERMGVHRATVARRIAAAREAIRDGAHRRLKDDLGMSEPELSSLAGLMHSQIDLSLAGLLRSP